MIRFGHPLVSVLVCAAITPAFATVAFAQQRPAPEPYEIKPEAGFGTGAQVQVEPDNFPERRQTNRQSLEQTQKVKAIVTRQTRFGIPFNVTQGALVAEAQLHISKDQGESWQLYSRQPPQAREFPFQSSKDGEFWFAIKTVDPNGIASPEGKIVAQMVIIVDTTEPEFNFNVHTDQSGKLECWLLASDLTLNADTLEVNYRPHTPFRMNLARWKKADFEIPSPEQSASRFETRFSFWPETESLTLDVQARITDRAGNVSTVDRRVLLSRLTDPKQRNAGKRPPSVDPYAARQDRIAKQIRWNDQQQQRVATNQNGWRSAAPATPPATIAKEDAERLQQLQQFQQRESLADNQIAIPPRIGQGSMNRNNDWNSPPSRLASRSEVGSERAAQSGSFESQPLGTDRDRFASERFAADESRGPNTRLASEDSRSSRNQSDTYYQESTSNSVLNSQSSQAGNTDFGGESSRIPAEIIRLSSSRKFQLEYEVDSIGPEGVAQVDIWMTEDEGRNWFVWGKDEDRQSPIIVNVDNDGLFGFRIGVTAKNGLSARPPRGGDDADVWIGVDSTKPIAQITSVPYGSGRDAGSLLINWTAQDRQLAEKPITLLYASNQDGPWNEIAADIDNSGTYPWRISQNMPREVFLRIEARDTAGNTTVYILNNPINLAGIVPRGRIRSVQPID